MSLDKWMPYFGNIDSVMEKAELLYFEGKICPLRRDLFRVFELIDPDEVRVVILGQDPGHTLNERGLPEADGIAFSSTREYNPEKTKWFTSMNYIITAIRADGQGDTFQTYRLDQWVKQGVLLMNTVFMTHEGKAYTCSELGWIDISRRIIKELAMRVTDRPLIFMLWGNKARSSKLYINEAIEGDNAMKGKDNILILESCHPRAPKVETKFVDSHHFALCNEFLVEHGEDPINWNLYRKG